jgi:hypothetical protein
MSTVKITQVSQYGWKVETENDTVLVPLVYLNKHEVENFVRNYISSFANWTYVIIPLTQETKNEDKKKKN